MLIIALVLALIGLVALVFAVVTSNELVAWVCIGASVLGVVLLIIDALRERQRADAGDEEPEQDGADEDAYVDYPEEVPDDGEQQSGLAETGGEESFGKAGPETESVVPADRRGEDPAK